jgi:hypothetical protein
MLKKSIIWKEKGPCLWGGKPPFMGRKAPVYGKVEK